MSSAFPISLALLAALTSPLAAGELKVCADPNNMPFSNQAGEGFENRIARVIADDLGYKLTYVWWAQRRGYIGEALDTGLCDLIPGIASIEGVLLTYPPYYRSSYVTVSRLETPAVVSFDDPALRTLIVGVEVVGDDGASTPPAAALARRGMTDNVRGFSVFGDYRQPSPPARIIDAVASGEIDVAFAWGPMAGWFARQHGLRVTPLEASADGDQPMAFDISMALRLDEGPLRKRVEAALDRNRVQVDRILSDYAVPRLDGAAQ
ncbi:MAG: quinoprotein dehydrogenase-associated putative ABC transporter substrate-binding protein [Devosia sp.]